MKFVKVLLILGIVAGVIFLADRFSGDDGGGASEKAGSEPKRSGGVRLEEKFGYTSETALP